jgi:hypothetical protein
MMTADELRAGLAHFYGTVSWYRHGLYSRLLLTDGTRFLAENASAWWLVDAIGSHIFTNRALNPRKEPFQVWKLEVSDNQTAKLTAGDGGKHGAESKTLVTQKIEYTDFPLPKIELWASWDEIVDERGAFVLLLPTEY